MIEQKKLEAFQFDQFYQKYFGKSIPFNQPEPPDPDISFHYESKLIGCELTTIYPDSKSIGGSKKRKKETLFKRLCQNIENELTKYYPTGYIITFRFNFGGYMRTKDNLFVEKVVAALCTHIDELEKVNNSIARFEGTINQGISDQIQVRISQFPEIETYINPSYGSFVPRIDSRQLYNFVQTKQNKISNYITSYKQLWLLLISQEGLSSDFEIMNPTKFEGSRFLWDKIFLFQMFGDRIIELK